MVRINDGPVIGDGPYGINLLSKAKELSVNVNRSGLEGTLGPGTSILNAMRLATEALEFIIGVIECNTVVAVCERESQS